MSRQSTPIGILIRIGCVLRALGAFGPSLVLSMMLFVGLAALPSGVRAQGAASTFNHMSTGFPLAGAHEQVRCETCHIKGIFKGTPRDCVGCHVQNGQRGALAKPVTHIQTTESCDSCHTIASFTGGRFNHVTAAPNACASCHNNVRAAGKPANHLPTTLSCDQCHVTSAFSPVRKFDHSTLGGNLTTCATCHDGHTATGRPATHIVTPNPGQCATCHMASTLNGFSSFAGGQMDHTGIVSGCSTCHGPNVGAGTFAGISSMVTMPPTSPVGAMSHIPSSTACETCHLANVPGSLIDVNAAAHPPGTGFAVPLPTSAQIHTGITSGCSSCHESNAVWMGMSAYPISPTTVGPNASYTGFQTRPKAAGGLFNVADPAHPSTGDCSQCHVSTSAFTATDKPANHIPTSATAQCSNCHTSTDFSVMPTLANIHANAPSTSGNCAQCHGTAAASFAIPAANFSIVGMPGNHIPTTAACELCHVGAGSSITATPVGNGAKFSGSLMSHSGISNNCTACHGPGITGSSFAGVSKIVVLPPTSPVGATSHIPSSTTCETCHLGTTPSGLIAASATKTAPGTAFATPAPTTAQIHTGITSGCASCHDSNFVWMGMSAYPIAPTTLTNGAQYTGFQTRPKTAAGTFSVADAAHPSTGDCSQCHSGTNFFTATDKPANHIPTSATAQCSNCHTSTDFSVMPTLANIHANAPSTSGNCAQCHGTAAASFAIPAANFSIVGMPGNHIPTTAACELCHVGAGSSITATPVGNGAKFSGSLMSHSGISNNCTACHGPGITGSSFAGVSKIVVLPPTSPVGATSHIPSSTTCETCHLGTTPSGLIAASATKTAPGTAFATPAPTTAQIHTGITSGCASCHDSNFVWMGMSAYPIAPTTLTNGAQYTGFQTRPKTAAGTFSVADAAHPSTGDCAQCHSGTNFFTATDKPANHIPTSATAQCSNCHTSTDFSVMPTLANIHANAPSTSGNCAQCHGTAAASFAIPAANFSIVGMPGNHIPTTAACELCHVGAGSSITATPVGNGAKFSGSLMSHSGISNNCAACHGPGITGSSFAGVSKIVVLPPTSPVGATSHIPSSTTCETCHLGTTPSGLIAASATKTAPGTAFATPAPTTAQIHTGITSGCASCHEASYVWMGMSTYPIAPTTLTNGAQYTGFHSRPVAIAGAYSVADAAHPSTGDCAQCHSGTNFFTATSKPANHIPTSATAQCSNCHTSTDFSVMPTLANIHANAPSTSGNCAQCHGTAAASFAIPAANFSIVGMPGNHIPTTAACELCHVGAGSSITATPVGNGAKFSGSLMSHSGITNNCAACHGPGITGSSFAGVSKIVVLPPTSPVGATSHIPSSTTCETCHLGTTPSGLIAASATKTAPGTAFATPAPTTAQIHTGITSGCTSCHEASYVWMGMSIVNYAIAPTTVVANAQYTGFQTRPKAAATTFSVADAGHPATGDCAQCHSGTNYFTGQGKPTGHIPTNIATCSTCHVSTGDYSVAGLTTNMSTLHTGITSACISCHTAGAGAGPFAGCSTSTACSSPPPVTYQPKVMPLLFGGSPTSPSAQTHIPVAGVACEKCHSSTVFTSFSTVPGATGMRGSSTYHAAVSAASCESCHEGGDVWYGVTIRTSGATPTSNHHGRAPGEDCTSCHIPSYSQFITKARVRPVMRAAVNAAGARLLPDGSALMAAPEGLARSAFNHLGVLPGQCLTCHNGQAAKGQPIKHIATRVSCDTCHRTTAWLPAQFSHDGVLPGQCQTCHNGASATGKSSSHFVTARSCDACHRTISWALVSYSHISPLYRAQPDKITCISCHLTNGEIIPRQLRGNLRPKPVPGLIGP